MRINDAKWFVLLGSALVIENRLWLPSLSETECTAVSLLFSSCLSECRHGLFRALLAVGYKLAFRKGELIGLRCQQVELKEHA